MIPLKQSGELRILNIGAGDAPDPRAIVPADAKVQFVRLDGNKETHPDVLHNIMHPLPKRLKGSFDIVFASHILEHIGWRDMVTAFVHMTEGVKPGGKIYIIVPDLLWACQKIIEGDYNYGVLGILYGGQKPGQELDYHRVGFTPDVLKMLFQEVGWVVEQIETSFFTAIVNGKRYTCQQLEAVGCRVDDHVVD